MYPIQTVLIIGITSLVLVGALLLVVRKMPSRPGVDWWMSSLLVVAFAYLLALIFIEKEKTALGELAFIVLQLSAHTGLTIGALLFFKQKISPKLCYSAYSIATLFVCLSSFYAQELWTDIVFVTYIACNMFYVSFCLLKLPEKNKSIQTTAVIYLLIGIHWLDYPFLKHVEWFAPIGFLIGVILGMSLGLSLALLALLQFEKQTKESEQRAIYAASHDPLTGLYNRSHLNKLFDDYVEESTKNDSAFVLLYLDLDGFKAINDTYGHKAGDVLLKVIAKRLTGWLKDRGDVVRIGGDELVVLSRIRLDGKNDGVYWTARKILDAIEQPIVDRENTYRVSASVGVCAYPEHGTHLERLLNQTDKLMYSAKRNGGKRIKFAEFAKANNSQLLAESETPRVETSPEIPLQSPASAV